MRILEWQYDLLEWSTEKQLCQNVVEKKQQSFWELLIDISMLGV